MGLVDDVILFSVLELNLVVVIVAAVLVVVVDGEMLDGGANKNKPP